jgi:CheY-like chemotaxis protein
MRILVVEDDPGSREALRTLLEILGHEVDEAGDGQRAVALAFERRPELILMDLGLPDVSGDEIARRIRGERGGDAFYMAAFTGHQPKPRGADGFDAYLLKPVAVDQLEALLAAVAAGRAHPAHAEPACGPAGRPAKPVLVVEDDLPSREAIVAALEYQGYGAVAASNGREALDLLHGGLEPCLIVLDLMMAVMDGWEFRRAQTTDPALAHIPVLVLSAHHEAAKLSGAAGIRAVLQKPVDLDQLIALVDAASTKTRPETVRSRS